MAFGWKRRMDTKDEAETVETPSSADETTGGAEGADQREGEPTPLEALAAAVARLESERDEALANGQRAMADYQNLRRRTQADIDAAAKRARGEVLSEALTVLDYLDMALATECTSEEGKNLQVGVAMTRGQLAAMLDRFRVKEIPATRVFDAAKHQAFATVETTEHEPGSIVETFRKGWMYGDQVLRHAQVRVAAAPKVTGPAADASTPLDDVTEGPGERVSD